MTRTKGALRWGAVFAGASAGLHLFALFVSGFSSEAVRLLPFAVLYAGFAYGLLQGWRWLAYVVFLVLFVGISFAISNVWTTGDVPGWLYGSIAVANLLSVTALLVALWKTPDTAVV